MIDYGDVVGGGITAGFGMVWAALAANPWLALLFAAIIVGGVWLQLTPTRRRRR